MSGPSSKLSWALTQSTGWAHIISAGLGWAGPGPTGLDGRQTEPDWAGRRPVSGGLSQMDVYCFCQPLFASLQCVCLLLCGSIIIPAPVGAYRPPRGPRAGRRVGRGLICRLIGRRQRSSSRGRVGSGAPVAVRAPAAHNDPARAAGLGLAPALASSGGRQRRPRRTASATRADSAPRQPQSAAPCACPRRPGRVPSASP